MNNKFFSYSLVALAISVMGSSGAMAESTTLNQMSSSLDSAGKQIEKSFDKGVNEVNQYSADSAITAKVKKAFMDDNNLSTFDISVVTENGLVTLSGFVDSVDKQAHAVKVAGDVSGVKSVNDNLHLKSDKESSLKGYTNDATITADIKAKLLTTDDISSMSIGVETVNGVVQLTGTVDKPSQSETAESVAKQIEGVKDVKNDLVIKS